MVREKVDKVSKNHMRRSKVHTRCTLRRTGDFCRAFFILSAMAMPFSSTAQAKPKFVTFTIGSVPTQPTSINSKGVVTGVFYSGVPEGFVRQPDGTTEAFGVPEAIQGTYPTSINKKGEVTGYYVEDSRRHGSVAHGFFRKADGTIKTFKIPDDNRGDFPVTVNSASTIFGRYDHGQNGHYGFVRDKSGTITTFDCPSGQTFVAAGNDLGASTGACNDGAYVRNSDGTFTFFDAGSSTAPTGINDAGSVTGTIGDQETLQGFLRTGDGTITTFSAGEGIPTTTVGINIGGVITGRFLEVGVMYHGFVRTADGTITTFDPTGSTNTQPTSINDKGAITGYYVDSLGKWIGFIRRP